MLQKQKKQKTSKQLSEWLWDAWCILSGIGIWPRYIEPRLLVVNRLNLSIHNLPSEFDGIKILQFSDLHWDSLFSPLLRKKLIRKVNALQPDLILFTGDFLCRSQLENRAELKALLCALKAKLGCYAVLGNHDYSEFVSINAQGDYDIEIPSTTSNITKGWNRLFHSVTLTRRVTPSVLQLVPHKELIQLLKETPFQLLDNTTTQIEYRGKRINLCGVGEYTAGKCNPEMAFSHYDKSYPGIILSHNPDTFDSLSTYPGDVILSGHTHGGQLNLPGLWKRFTRMENYHYKHGLKKVGAKWAYINRGVSSVMKFRWFAPPELTFFTLQRGKK